MDAPIMGVREWKVSEAGDLHSIGVPGVWGKGVQKAECKKCDNIIAHLNAMRLAAHVEPTEPELHDAPHKGCGCGLYAFYDLKSCERYGGKVPGNGGIRGVVSAWGKVVCSEYGFKAEYMKLEALIGLGAGGGPEYIKHWGVPIDLNSAYQHFAERHGVPLIKAEEVSAFMGLSGGTVLEPEPLPRPSKDGCHTPRAFETDE